MQSAAYLGLELIGGQGGTINYEGSAVAHADPMDGSSPPLLTDEFDWSGDFLPGTPIATNLGSLPKWELDEVERFYFDSFVGELFALDFFLDTVASSDGPFEVYTLADLAANYRLKALDPVTLDPLPVSLFVPESAPDLDADGQINCNDVDALTTEIAAGTNHPDFDLNGDGMVDTVDLDQWLSIGGAFSLPSGQPIPYGDANLDGLVDGADFLIWNTNKFTAGTGWCSGNFNADGQVDGRDFLIWNLSKFITPDQLQSIPEPVCATWWLVGLVMLWLTCKCGRI